MLSYATLKTPATPPPARRMTRPLRVCHVSLTLKTGGLERILADLARHHHPAEWTPTFVAMKDVGRFADEIRRSGCPVHQLQSSTQFGQVRELARFLRKGAFDVVHTHNTYPHVYASLAARLAGVPVVVQTRHGQRAGHGWKSRFMYRNATWLVDRIITVSDDAARLCIDSDGIHPAKVTRIWNGIDLHDFVFRGPARQPVAMTVARLSAEKDFPTLLKAVPLVVRKVPAFQLRIVGDGPERASLEGLSRELGITGRVEWLGERTDVPALLGEAGFFVSSSLTEGISLTLLEAMAVGLPIVATAVGGNPEIVVDGLTGRLVPAADPEALAGAIIELCESPSDWMSLGLAGHERVLEHFDVRRMVADYGDLYRTLYQRKSSKRTSSSGHQPN